MIEIKDFTFSYKDSKKNALNNINLSINDGEFVGIIGESGSGKTTLCNSINALIPHHFQGEFYGSVKTNGTDTFDITPGELAVNVGSVFQDIDSQLVNSFVDDEIRFGLENHGVPKNQIEERITQSLICLGIEELRNREIISLSGGQKQKVAIASILALEPKIIVLDEPTGELDPVSSRQIFSFLRKINEEKKITIVVVEQKIMLLCEFATRLLVLENGNLVADDSVRKILGNPEKLKAEGINCPRVASLVNEMQKNNLILETILKEKRICINTKEAASLIQKVVGEN